MSNPYRGAERLPLWILLDQMERKAREGAGALELDEVATVHGTIEAANRSPAPTLIVLLKARAFVALPGPNGVAEIYGHRPGREWEVVHAAFPHPINEGLAEVLIGLCQEWAQREGIA